MLAQLGVPAKSRGVVRGVSVSDAKEESARIWKGCTEPRDPAKKRLSPRA